MVLCDIGNTTYHFKYGKKDFKIAINSKKLPNITKKIYYISVNKSGTKRLLKQYPLSVDISKFVNFKTKYQGIGIDRVVASYSIKNGIIIDVGSAITVDIMKNSKHKGGFILLGFLAFSKNYPKISKKLKFNFKKNINLDKIPLNTNDAINYAIYSSIIETIKMIKDLGAIEAELEVRG
jgi:type III pantothenate kinase